MAGPVRISILANASQATSAFNQVQSRASRMGQALKTAAVGGLLVAGAAAVKFGADSVKAASDAQQSLGATEQVFGRYAKTVIDRSNDASRAVGLSANEYRELNNVLGASLTAAGVPLRQTADLTDKLTGRAADLAATFGGTTREAIEAVSSLLRGEADPIERYGVSIKESDVSARLAAKGLDNLTGSALKQAQIQARMDLLFQQSSKSAGQFGRESDTLAGKQQRLAARFEDVKARVGTLLLPVLIDLAGVAENTLVPALEKGVTWFEKNRDEIGSTARAIGDSLLPPLKTLGEIAGSVANFLGDLPRPLQEVGLQAAAAALILPRLTRGFAAASAGASGLTTAARTGTGRLLALRGAAGGLAGVGGMVALTQGATASDKALGALGTTAGGALLGFSLGGPIGGAIGAGAGALYGLYNATKKSSDGMEDAKPPAESYADTLDQVTGAATRQTRALVLKRLEERGLVSSSRQLGIETRDIIDASLGERGAIDRVTRAYRGRKDVLTGLESNRVRDFIRENSLEFGRERQEVRETNSALTTYAEVLRGMPKKVRTRIEALNYDPTQRQLQRIIRTANLTPREKKILIREFGTTRVNRRIRDLNRDLSRTGRVRPDLGPWNLLLQRGTQRGQQSAQRAQRNTNRELARVGRTRPFMNFWQSGLDRGLSTGRRAVQRGTSGLSRDLTRGTSRARPDLGGYNRDLSRLLGGYERDAESGGRDIGDRLRRGTSTASPDLGPFNSGVRDGIGSARGTASSGGYSVGSSLKSGVIAGFAGTQTALVNQAVAAVNAAVQSARNAAQSRSPSRKMMKVGRDLGDGLAVGLASKRRKGSAEARKLALAMIAASGNGMTEISRKIEAIGKAHKKNAAAIRGAINATTRLRAALAANARAQQAMNDKLRDARSRLKDLEQTRNEYAASVRQSLLSYASVTSVEEGHLNSTESFLEGLRERAAEAQRFAELVTKLKNQGLNAASLRQILDAGPEAGRAAAEAIAAGGAQTIAEVNKLTKQLGDTGTTLGDQMGNHFYKAGIDAQKQLIKGLERQDKNLDRAANRIATNIVKALRKRLGIKGNVNLPINPIPKPKSALRADETYARSSEPRVIKVKLTAQQTTSIQRGREIEMDLREYRKAGGRA